VFRLLALLKKQFVTATKITYHYQTQTLTLTLTHAEFYFILTTA